MMEWHATIAPAGRGRILLVLMRGRAQPARAWTGAACQFGNELDRLAVSPDGRTILDQQQTISNDLVLIDNFRW